MAQAINCRHCGKFIDTILSDRPIISFHSACYLLFCEELEECGIRIGMRIHGDKKRLTPADHALADKVE